MPAGVVVSSVNAVMRAAEKPRSLPEEVVLELERGRGEHGDEEAGAGEEPQPAAMRRKGGFGVLLLEPAALRQPATDDDDEGESEQCDRVDPSPTSVTGVRQRQHPHAHARAERADHRDQAECVRP